MKRRILLSLVLVLFFMVYSNDVYAQWYQISQLKYTNIYCMLTANDSSVFVGGDNGTLLRSVDAGSTWTNIMGNGFWVDTVLSLGKGLGYIFAGAYGAGGIFRSSDGGETWDTADIGLPSAVEMNAFAFYDSVLFAATDHGVYSSADSGNSWQPDTSGLNIGIVYPGENHGAIGIQVVGKSLYAIMYRGGTVYKASLDSISWHKITNDYYNSGFAIAAMDTNVFIATQTGIYLYGGDTSWLPKNNGLPVNDSTPMFSCMFTMQDTLLFAYILTANSGETIYQTSDLGEHWKRIDDSVLTSSVTSIVSDKNYLFAGTEMGGWRKKISGNVTAIRNDNLEHPEKFELSQNYPNPFNPTTIIKYSIPVAQNISTVQLKVYDILGRVVAALVNKEQMPGNYEVQFNASNLPSGVYFYRLTFKGLTQSKKMILLK
jgi:photosystem II stability/assembly factor-like uncharacterized protein